MSNKADEIKSELVFYAKLLEEKGYANSYEGNISILDRETDILYITPSATRKSFLNEDMVACMKGDEQIGGTLRRSSEYLLHIAALNARSDCIAAVHTHSPYLTAYAYSNQSIKLKCSTTFALLFEDIPCLPYGEPGTKKIADGLEVALKDRPLILLGNHGVLSVGRSAEEAVALIESAEDSLRAYHLAKQLGTVPDIPEDEYEHLMSTNKVSVRLRYL